MSYAFGFVGLIFLGALVGFVLTGARRRLEMQDPAPYPRRTKTDTDPDAAPLVRDTPVEVSQAHTESSRHSVFGSAEQRLQALWACAAGCGGAVVLVALGAPIIGQLVLFVGVIVAVQVGVMGALAHIRKGRKTA